MILYLVNALATCSVQFRHGSRKVLGCRRCYSQDLKRDGIAAFGVNFKVVHCTCFIFGRHANLSIILHSGSYCGWWSTSINNLSGSVLYFLIWNTGQITTRIHCFHHRKRASLYPRNILLEFESKAHCNYRSKLDRWPNSWKRDSVTFLTTSTLWPKSQSYLTKMCYTQSNSVRKDVRTVRLSQTLLKTGLFLSDCDVTGSSV